MEVHWRSRPATEVLSHTASATLVCAMENIFPNIQCLLALVFTIPFSAVECKRSLSYLRSFMTYLRSTMGSTRLPALALLHTHYNLEIGINAVISLFKRKTPLRMVAVDFMS